MAAAHLHTGPLSSANLSTDTRFLKFYIHTNHQYVFFFFFNQALSEEISQERNERQRLERDLDEASRRLAMAHQDIRRLTNELDAAKNNTVESSGTP